MTEAPAAERTGAPLVEIGSAAPDFELVDQHGVPTRLSELRGRAVALVFYPFAFSGICTGELREVRDTLEDFQTDDVQVLAISCDPMFSLRAWADAEGHFFPLLSDFWPHGSTALAYGVFDPRRGCAQRATVLVDSGGVVRFVQLDPVSRARDFSAYREALRGLRQG